MDAKAVGYTDLNLRPCGFDHSGPAAKNIFHRAVSSLPRLTASSPGDMLSRLFLNGLGRKPKIVFFESQHSETFWR